MQDFVIGFVSGACIGAAVVLWIWAFCGKANAQINADIIKHSGENMVYRYNDKGEDK
ncbi:hypothetical protein [Pectinatus haikarae]|uniref:Gas vesicle protein n=1 Tax=Pectinatus haikarae TaxID=349096 RepID=A0ABT9Y3V5_9FIRM|nr:hypothetical protein [Pectinatus haikarae]MDQ0202510.1 gas vesicle protein [Pectinatus haikarae]